MSITTAILIFIIGIIAAGYGTIVGAGGGFIFVPALLILFGMDPTVAAASGLVIVLINSVSGVFGYAKAGQIECDIGLIIGISALPGALLGVWLLQVYSSDYFYIIFATVLVGLGVFLFYKNFSFGQKAKTTTTTKTPRKISHMWLIPLGVVMGVFSSYLGIGGGWLLVPILIYIFSVSTHHAAATSIFSLCLYTTVGVIMQLFYGNIDWTVVLCGGLGVIVGSQLGVYISGKISGKRIIQMLSLVLIVIGVRMYFS